MRVLGFLGSPRLKGKCSALLQSALDGAASQGAEVKRFDLITHNIKYCMGCGTCYLKNPDLAVGKCPLKDDVASILHEYVQADGYIFATPVYDMFVTALTKTFLERMIALTYKSEEEIARLPAPRPGVAKHFTAKASFIVTGNCGDELVEVMGDPCFEAFDGHLMIQQVDTVDKLYVGGVENMTDAVFSERLAAANRIGKSLAEAIAKEQTVNT